MSWTAGEQAAIFGDYWKAGVSACPRCKASVQPKRRTFAGGYAILATCTNGCGSMQMADGQDPLAGTFRDWTAAQCHRIMEDYLADRPPACPVDATALSVQEIPIVGGIMVKAHCPRCGQAKNRDFPG